MTFDRYLSSTVHPQYQSLGEGLHHDSTFFPGIPQVSKSPTLPIELGNPGIGFHNIDKKLSELIGDLMEFHLTKLEPYGQTIKPV